MTPIRHARWTVAVIVLAAIAMNTGALAAEPQMGTVVRLTAETEVAAAPEQVWDHMTSGVSLVTWCPYWKNPDNAKISLAAVGDVLDFMDEWGGGGRSIVTFLEPQKELRVAHEPADGSYLCQSKLTLSAGKSGTKVVYAEQYTDDSKPEDRKATAAKMQKMIDGALLALKKGVEGR